MSQIVLAVRDPVSATTRTFDQNEILVGRAEESDVVLADRAASRRHARLVRDGGAWWIEDLGSRAGTRHNSTTVTVREPLAPGDQIGVGTSLLVVERIADRDAPRPRPVSTSSAPAPGTSVFMRAADLLSSSRGGDLDTDALRRRADRLELLNEVHRALGRSMALPELLELILDNAWKALAPEEGVIVLRDGPGRYRRATARRAPGSRAEALLSRTLHEEVIEKRQAALVCDIAADERFGHAASLMMSGIRSLIAAPLFDDQGPLGMIALDSRAHVRSFTADDLELLTSLASVAALRIRNIALVEESAERRRLEEEIKLARAIQVGLLPRELPALPGWSLHGGSVPSRGVSGDYYLATLRRDDTELFGMIVDVSGKGMGAALLTASLEALAASPVQNGMAPGEIAPLVSNLLYRRTPLAKYATALLVSVDIAGTSNGRLGFTNAGHNPALLVRADGAVERLGATGPPIGLLAQASFTEQERYLAPGDLLVLYTDGIVEACDPDDEEFGLERLEAFVAARRATPLEEISEGLDQALEEFVRGVPYADDRTLVILRRDAIPA
ncbi:MAG: SpoIIE family protein phosphatase [Thermoanaerobaculia bacterium]|nr:SpoIIE family protein phosphatase [Thermoanaerobaculia bacterium]MBP9825475.1 SpoIIE family protein phosphatase [Thermoanaerobaculia bacterium]